MNIIKYSLVLIYLSISFSSFAMATLTISYEPKDNGVPLGNSILLIDKNEKPVVATAGELFAADYRMVTGKSLSTTDHPVKNKNLIIAGTVESKYIKDLCKKGLIDLDSIKSNYERFLIQVIKNPFSPDNYAIVVAGSDARGAAYGLMEISERMGVSPWSWWADVPSRKRDEIYISGSLISKEPSVRYRGIFINDEDWGLVPWAAKTYEPEIGNIGPRTYARICELLLRLRANMLAPAMHTCSDAFYTNPENKKIADKYGILITTSHCEPLLFNNASKAEWDSAKDGEWNYKSNKETIFKKLDNRVKEASSFENIYTLAMRGLHDEGMRGNLSKTEKVAVLQQAIDDQRNILDNHISGPVDKIPQIFIPYKEAQQLYEAGLDVPEDVTLVWPDDNYGYMKMLSNPNERKRKGGAGVYYHLSYLGVPHSYLWLSTTPPVLIYEEMKKAFDTGADRYWLLNVGDIKPMELSMQFFFHLARDFESFDYVGANLYQAEFLAEIFGNEFRGDFQNILDEYYRLAWCRKPEAMGWEREWDSKEFTGLHDTDFSFANYNDATLRLQDYSAIADKTDEIMNSLPEELRPSFFEMIGYPVLGSNQMNRKFLLSQLNHELADAGDIPGANMAARLASLANDSIDSLNHEYNSLLNGKWKGMMTVPPAICALNHLMPDLYYDPDGDTRELNLNPDPLQYVLENCMLVPVESFDNFKGGDSHSFRILKGLGYDWTSLMLGEVTEPSFNPLDKNAPGVSYTLPAIESDSIRIILYTLPRFPIYKGSGATFGLSIDNSDIFISNFIPREQSREWKDNVIRNGMITEAVFAIDKSAGSHRLNIISGDPGLIIQRILIDWGGLRKTYVGPDKRLVECGKRFFKK